MSWDYRIMCHDKGTDDEYYAIHEFYPLGIRGEQDTWTIDPVAPYGDTPEALRATLHRYLSALTRPIIDIIEGKAIERRPIIHTVPPSADVGRQQMDPA